MLPNSVFEMPILKCYQLFCNKNCICVTCLLDLPGGGAFCTRIVAPGTVVLQSFCPRVRVFPSGGGLGGIPPYEPYVPPHKNGVPPY